MKSKAVEIYALVVCGLSLIIAVAVFGTVAKQTMLLAFPSFRLTESQVRIYGNDDQYRLQFKDAVPEIPDGEVEARRLDARAVALQGARQGAVRELLEYSPVFLSFLFLAWVHWRLARRSAAAQGAA